MRFPYKLFNRTAPSGRDGVRTSGKVVISQSGFELAMCNISETILLLATKRGKDKTICPSEVARELSGDDWRRHMQEIRKTAFELRDAGKVLIMQKGREVDGNEVVGPIRIKIN